MWNTTINIQDFVSPPKNTSHGRNKNHSTRIQQKKSIPGKICIPMTVFFCGIQKHARILYPYFFLFLGYNKNQYIFRFVFQKNLFLGDITSSHAKRLRWCIPTKTFPKTKKYCIREYKKCEEYGRAKKMKYFLGRIHDIISENTEKIRNTHVRSS